jgi:dihydropteroate synthase
VIWRLTDRTLTWAPAQAPLVMGVVNVTPDSFSDGGRLSSVEAAVRYGLELVAAGADLLDVGGESTRPGADPVPSAQERARVESVIRGLARATGVPISVDTRKAVVAEAALDAGAHVVNDVTGLRGDPAMAALVAARGAGCVVMHMRGEPHTMQALAHGAARAADPEQATAATPEAVEAFFVERLATLALLGVEATRICLDVGVGFGKTDAENLALIASLPRLACLGRPLLVGTSRKSFLGRLTGRPVEARGAATVAADAVATFLGASMLRVHAPAEARDAARLGAALRAVAEPRVAQRSPSCLA